MVKASLPAIFKSIRYLLNHSETVAQSNAIPVQTIIQVYAHSW